MNQFEPLEKMWGELLSRQPDLVISAYEKLDTENRKNVIQHLQTMAKKKGWHIEQKKSAQIALNAILSKFPKLSENKVN